MENEIVIIGCGDIGRRLAPHWLAQGRSVAALARSSDSARRLQALGLPILPGDLDDATSLACLCTPRLHARIVYYLAPPPGEGEGDPRIEHLLACLAPDNCPAQLIYMGTSGVYGDYGGAWVDEHSPVWAQAPRAKRRLAAESALHSAATRLGFALTLLRVGGIYGPGRLPLTRLQKGLPVLCEAESGFSNRIHVEDLLQILLALAEQPAAGVRLYNISDNHPGSMTGYFLAVAAALGLPQPPQISLAEARQQLSPAMLSYLGESRRMDSRKVLHELGIELRYPELRDGLRALRQQGKVAGDC